MVGEFRKRAKPASNGKGPKLFTWTAMPARNSCAAVFSWWFEATVPGTISMCDLAPERQYGITIDRRRN